jgi:hypothetical protein
MKIATALFAVAALALASTSPADAKGCIKGAVVGGVAGHYAGHHGVIGAIAGGAGEDVRGRTCPRPSFRGDAKHRTRKVELA